MDAGLEGVLAAETRLSDVRGEEGRLIVCGFDLETLVARFGFEETAALLWTGATDPAMDGDAVREALAAARMETGALLPRFAAATDGLSPIEALRLGLSMLPEEAAAPAHIRVTAAIPVFLAAQQRRRSGLDPVAPSAGRRQTADFLHMLSGSEPDPAKVRALETYLVTVADHGLNASTFTARVVASTRPGILSAVIAGLCALKGPLHGGAPGPVLDMFDEIGGEARIAGWVRERLDAKDRLMGFGHRVYRARDPRADILKAEVARLRGTADRIAFAEKVERGVLEALAERYPGRRLETNVEFYTALLLDAVGVARDTFTALFAMGRVLGWTAHAFEQIGTGRLVRPASVYVGPQPAEPHHAAVG
ncbi:MAG: citrate synthase/methylcitrate synthase [Alphaproteobacteria bacterium]